MVVVLAVVVVAAVMVLAYPALRILVRGVAAFRLGALQAYFGPPKRTADTLAHKDPHVRVCRLVLFSDFRTNLGTVVKLCKERGN